MTKDKPKEKRIIEEKECKACGHKWFPRTPERPFICPKCKSARWDVGKLRHRKPKDDTE